MLLTLEDHLTEYWKPVVEFEGIYSVSNIGRVRRDKPANGTYPGKILTPGIDKDGYLRVVLTDAPRRVTYSVHILVARAFLGPCPPGQEVNHIDASDPTTMKFDNRVSNLEYVTKQQNHDHAKISGLKAKGANNGMNTHPECRPNIKGEQHGKAKLTTEQVQCIRIAGGSQSSIASQFGISQATVSKIKRKVRWKHLS